MSTVNTSGQEEFAAFDLMEALQNLPGVGKVDASALPDPADWRFSIYERFPVMPSKSCPHDVSAALKEKVDCIKNVCPPCLIKSGIADIKKTQAGVEARGGVFASKGQIRTEKEWNNHRAWMRRWTKLKIKCATEVNQFEQVQSAFPEQSEAWGIGQALEIWVVELEECVKVPGYIYATELPDEASKVETKMGEDEEVKISKDEKVEVVQKDEAKVVENEPLSSQELNDLLTDNREWRMVKPRRKRNKSTKANNSKKTEVGWLSDTGNKVTLPTARAAQPDTDEDTLEEADHVITQFNKQSKMTTSNRFDALFGAQHPRSDTVPTTKAPSTPSVRRAPLTACHPTTPTSYPSPTTPTPRSALKRSNPPRTPNRHIEFSESVTIYPSPTDSTAPSSPVMQKPHNSYTIAEISRDTFSFHRASPRYTASTWCSPAGYEKVDTSYMSLTWPRYEHTFGALTKQVSTVQQGPWKNEWPARSRSKGVGFGNKKHMSTTPSWAHPGRTWDQRLEAVRKMRHDVREREESRKEENKEKEKANHVEVTEKQEKENLVEVTEEEKENLLNPPEKQGKEYSAVTAADRGAKPAVLQDKGLRENVNGGFRSGVAERESER